MPVRDVRRRARAVSHQSGSAGPTLAWTFSRDRGVRARAATTAPGWSADDGQATSKYRSRLTAAASRSRGTPSSAEVAYRPGSADQSSRGRGQVLGDRAAVPGGRVRPAETAMTASASPGPARRRRPGPSRPSGGRASGGTSRRSDLAGMTAVYRPRRFPAERPVQRHRRRVQRRQRVAARRDLVEQGGHQRPGRCRRPRYSGATLTLAPRPSAPRGRATTAACRWNAARRPGAPSAKAPRYRPPATEAGQRPDPPVAIGGGPGPEGPFGQVELGVGIVARAAAAGAAASGASQPSFSMISSDTDSWRTRPARRRSPRAPRSAGRPAWPAPRPAAPRRSAGTPASAES